RARGKGYRHFEKTLLAVRECAAELVRTALQSHEREYLACECAKLRFLLAQPRKRQQRLPYRCACMAMQSDQHVLEDGIVCEDTRFLEGAHETKVRHFVRLEVSQRNTAIT